MGLELRAVRGTKSVSMAPIPPPCSPTQWLLQGLPAESKVLAAEMFRYLTTWIQHGTTTDRNRVDQGLMNGFYSLVQN